MELEQFVDNIKIEKQNNHEYGYYPFSLVAIDKKGRVFQEALAGLKIQACNERFAYYYKKKFPVIYMAIDFPPVLDIKTDFVMVYHVKDGVGGFFALPYDSQTGKQLEGIKLCDSPALEHIGGQLYPSIFPAMSRLN